VALWVPIEHVRPIAKGGPPRALHNEPVFALRTPTDVGGHPRTSESGSTQVATDDDVHKGAGRTVNSTFSSVAADGALYYRTIEERTAPRSPSRRDQWALSRRQGRWSHGECTRRLRPTGVPLRRRTTGDPRALQERSIGATTALEPRPPGGGGLVVKRRRWVSIGVGQSNHTTRVDSRRDESPIRRLATRRRVARQLNATVPPTGSRR
jgi:hypothetical protein